MALSITCTSVDHTTTAGFRVWGLEFHAQLAACGLVQTADTGQINWATVTLPASSVFAGSEVWRFTDTLQSTVPVFLIFTFGSSPNGYPSIKLTVCGSTNGASSPPTFYTTGNCGSNSFGSTVPAGAFPSRFIFNPTLGFFGFLWKQGGNIATGSVDSPYQAGFVFRSNNSSGVVNGEAVMVFTASGNQLATSAQGFGIMQCMNFDRNIVYPNVSPVNQGQVWAIHPFNGAFSLGSSQQLIVDSVFFMTPTSGIGITNCLARALKTEVPVHSQISLTLVGSTPHNYIQTGNVFGCYNQIAYTGQDMFAIANSNMGMLMLWE